MLPHVLSLALNLEKKSGESLYLSNSTKLRVKNIVSFDQNVLLVTTSSVCKNMAVFEDKWEEITFTFKYDLTHKDAVEFIQDLKYEDYIGKGIDFVDFIKIKSLGRKVYKFFALKAEFDMEAKSRLLDLNNYDDVSKIKNFYYKQVLDYELVLDSQRDFEMFKEEDQEKHEKNSEILKIWEARLDKILEEMDSEEDTTSEGECK
jgi:hypothetical protein